MRHVFFSLALVCAVGLLRPFVATAITIATVPIGNQGNAIDPTYGFGGVAYNYSIGKYDVTVSQYTAFLNAVAASDTYGLYNPKMATDLNVAGIAQSGVSGSYTYSVIGSANHPITYVSWGDAARFANWLQNGQPTGAEGPGTTETGSYALNGAITNAALIAVTRKFNAIWVIPTESEWYKAAYYNPATGSYYQYPTSSNTTPTSAPPGNTPNTANFNGDTTGYAVTGSTSYSSSQNYLTDVGAYTASASAYGTFDQCGNAVQWNETLISSDPSQPLDRGLRGGAWGGGSFLLGSFSRSSDFPLFETEDIGFRVAEIAVPEPASLVLLMVGVIAVLPLACAARIRRP